MGDYADDQLRGWVKNGMPRRERTQFVKKCDRCGNFIRTITGNFTTCSETGTRHLLSERPRLGTSFPGNETFDDEPGRT